MSAPIIETKQGKICGKLLSVKPELSERKCVNFNNVPFGKYKRFERPEPYGKWDGIWDGTGLTPMQPQHNILYDPVLYDAAHGLCMFPENGREQFEEIPSK